ncbi:hypothetical protein PQQ75_15840 [Paraburkholderia aspalathi]|uniref:hypothetical protein n=1 Tax=Paraburkholderia aspalathi TaxID=1324617 RepID=UPI0038BE0E42
MNTLDLEKATEGLAVGDEFGSLPSFNKGMAVSTIMGRFLDQPVASGRLASVHE